MLSQAPAAPIGDEAVAIAFAPLERADTLLLAISGGPDSTALALLAARWARAPGRPGLHAATVDHGLRQEAGAESAAVARFCASLGIVHHALSWRGDKPQSRLQERAREARYALLGECAKTIGAPIIVTAHHADDQAETVLFRLLRGSNIAGLAGMSAATPRHGFILARPLLPFYKEALIAVCEAAGAPYAHDLSNENPRFARVRMRALLRQEGLSAPSLLRLARRAGQVEQALGVFTATARRRLGDAPEIDAKALFAEPREIAQRIIGAKIAALASPPSRELRLEALEALVEALDGASREGRRHKANLAGVSVSLDATGIIRFAAEAARRNNSSSAGA